MRIRAWLAALVLVAACTAASPTPEPSPSEEPSPAASATATPSPTAAPSDPAATPAPPPTWTPLAVDGGPAAREDHTWTVDGDGAVAYLFGGRDGATVYGDLWAYDLAADAWSALAPAGSLPPARFGHEAAWVDGTGVVIFAGQAGSAFFNDLWAYDPGAGTWRQLPASGAVPVARYGTCAALGPDGRLWISHGFTSDGIRFADTVAYDFATGIWTEETPLADRPIARCLHGCWWTDDERLVLYAGQTTGVTALGDLWELRRGERPGTNAWAEIAGTLPSERNLYARARIDAATLVFGGQALDGSYVGGLWSFADDGIGAVAVQTAGDEPPGRAGAEMVRDAARGRVLLFGGRDGGGALADLWALTIPDG
jgi:hypothetical protein